MGNIAKILSTNLTSMRRNRGWTQEFLAELSHLSLRQYQAIESGESWPGKKTVEKISAALGVPEPRLFEAPEFTKEPTIPEAIQRIAAEFGLRVTAKRKPRKTPNTPSNT